MCIHTAVYNTETLYMVLIYVMKLNKHVINFVIVQVFVCMYYLYVLNL